MLAEERHGEGRSRPRLAQRARGGIQQLRTAFQLLGGTGQITAAQRVGRSPQRGLAVAQIAVRLRHGDRRADQGQPDEATGDEQPPAHVAASPATAPGQPTDHDHHHDHAGDEGGHPEPGRAVPPQQRVDDQGRRGGPAGREADAPCADQHARQEGGRGEHDPHRPRGDEDGQRRGRRQRPPRGGGAGPRHEAGHRRGQHDVGGPPRRRADVRQRTADGAGGADRDDGDEVALRDPVAPDAVPRRAGGAAGATRRRRHRPRSWWTSGIGTGQHRAPSRRPPRATSPTASGGRRPSRPPARRRSAAAVRAPG